jgi:hypothetical protein
MPKSLNEIGDDYELLATTVGLGLARIVVSEIEVPIMLANLI